MCLLSICVPKGKSRCSLVRAFPSIQYEIDLFAVGLIRVTHGQSRRLWLVATQPSHYGQRHWQRLASELSRKEQQKENSEVPNDSSRSALEVRKRQGTEVEIQRVAVQLS